MADERSSQLYLENCIQREISYENKRVELIQQDIRGNVNNIIKKQTEAKWGSGFLNQLSADLTEAFPDMQGFSKRNLELIRKWYSFYNEEKSNTKQVVSQLQEALFQVPWGHHIKIVSKCTSLKEAQFYIYKIIEHGWSRNVLTNMIESGLYQREGASINNFSLRLPSLQSDWHMN